MGDDLIARLRKAAHIEPEEVAELMEEAADALEAAREDAERWRFCVERDTMPVMANDGKTWCMFVAVSNRRRSLFTGLSPAEAIDAARKEARND